MPSISRRLFLVLVLSTGAVWLSAVAWIYFSTRMEVERVLDARLIEAGRMVSTLVVRSDQGKFSVSESLIHDATADPNQQLSCQIWSLGGVLIGRSDGAPSEELTQFRDGISETIINGETWRVFAMTNEALGVRVLIGDNLRLRDGLVNDVIRGLLLPASFIFPLLGFLIWLSIKRGLDPLNKIASNLASRKASDLSPLADVNAAKEVVPVVQALNDLFNRVTTLRDRERNFTAFAAHELKTPLAGLRTQAQIALSSTDDAIRNSALQQMLVGVDRTGRLLRQLLDLSEIEAMGRNDRPDEISPGVILRQLALEVSRPEKPVVIEIGPELDGMRLEFDTTLFTLAARNLLENAVNHSPIGGKVVCRFESTPDAQNLLIEDNGPGIPTEELPRVTERFFRGRNKVAVGSGLGLAIAELSLGQTGWRLSISNRPTGGVRASIEKAA